MIPHDVHLQIGSLLFEGLDQIDLTGPYEVLSRIPNSTYRIYAKTVDSVRDVKGLRLTPDATLADAPPLDVLRLPGGFGQEALMEDEEVLAWISRQAAGACSIFSVCTGALLRGRRHCWYRRRLPVGGGVAGGGYGSVDSAPHRVCTGTTLQQWHTGDSPFHNSGRCTAIPTSYHSAT
jgi:putative intracellular protease/amidase